MEQNNNETDVFFIKKLLCILLVMMCMFILVSFFGIQAMPEEIFEKTSYIPTQQNSFNTPLKTPSPILSATPNNDTVATPIPLPVLNINTDIDPKILSYLESVSDKYELSLLQGIIQLECEGTWNPNFIDNEDYGLSQINKCNHKMLNTILTEKYGYFDILDYRQNIDSMILMLDIFSEYLNENLGREPTISEILTAYNRGPYYAQTKGIYEPYVDLVIKYQQEYQIWNTWRNAISQ